MFQTYIFTLYSCSLCSYVQTQSTTLLLELLSYSTMDTFLGLLIRSAILQFVLYLCTALLSYSLLSYCLYHVYVLHYFHTICCPAICIMSLNCTTFILSAKLMIISCFCTVLHYFHTICYATDLIRSL